MGDSLTLPYNKRPDIPFGVILYLTHYPEGAFKQALYIIGWAALNTALEYIACLLGGIYYDHGWNLPWSFALLAIGFSLVPPAIIKSRCSSGYLRLYWERLSRFIFGLPFPK